MKHRRLGLTQCPASKKTSMQKEAVGPLAYVSSLQEWVLPSHINHRIHGTTTLGHAVSRGPMMNTEHPWAPPLLQWTQKMTIGLLQASRSCLISPTRTCLGRCFILWASSTYLWRVHPLLPPPGWSHQRSHRGHQGQPWLLVITYYILDYILESTYLSQRQGLWITCPSSRFLRTCIPGCSNPTVRRPGGCYLELMPL